MADLMSKTNKTMKLKAPQLFLDELIDEPTFGSLARLRTLKARCSCGIPSFFLSAEQFTIGELLFCKKSISNNDLRNFSSLNCRIED